ncbi:hypothetical protein JOB18_044988 [Solea senegalensis]|uniref:Uncharacterized protein n=1 Tax=Solea senegalensis TaxID=28829 RepID=A0AAV6S5K4_SOLSE|nr:hypothetical protein JOB18_044988 [Solea senegalensis]
MNAAKSNASLHRQRCQLDLRKAASAIHKPGGCRRYCCVVVVSSSYTDILKCMRVNLRLLSRSNARQVVAAAAAAAAADSTDYTHKQQTPRLLYEDAATRVEFHCGSSSCAAVSDAWICVYCIWKYELSSLLGDICLQGQQKSSGFSLHSQFGWVKTAQLLAAHTQPGLAPDERTRLSCLDHGLQPDAYGAFIREETVCHVLKPGLEECVWSTADYSLELKVKTTLSAENDDDEVKGGRELATPNIW